MSIYVDDHLLDSEGNNVPAKKNFGKQTFVDEEGLGSDDVFMYKRITGTPLSNLITRPYDNELTAAQIKSGIYRRVILVRYTGEITEVFPEEYDKYKEQWNTDQVRSALRLIDNSLHTSTIQFFKGQANFEGTPSRRLAIDIYNYKSPLSEK